LANFSKEFYHWLLVGYNEAQRCCVWFVRLRIRRIFSCSKSVV